MALKRVRSTLKNSKKLKVEIRFFKSLISACTEVEFMNVSTNKQCLPLIIGHRGASAQKPENTIPAFDLALELEADGIEFDVRLASDGVPVVIHDPDLKRTGRQTGLVRKSSSAELEKIDAGTWFNLKHPTLAD